MTNSTISPKDKTIKNFFRKLTTNDLVLIVEDEQDLAKKFSEILETQFAVKTIIKHNASSSIELLEKNKAIKYLISTYNVTDQHIDRSQILQNYCTEQRPEISHLVIGYIPLNEVTIGQSKILLENEDTFRKDVSELVFDQKIYPLKNEYSFSLTKII